MAECIFLCGDACFNVPVTPQTLSNERHSQHSAAHRPP